MILHEKAYGATNIVASRLPCEVGSVRGYFRGSTDRWLQLHDASQLPANGAVPVFSIPLYATAYYSWDWPRLRSMSNGAIFAVSTTEATLTISSDLADFFVDGTAATVLSSPSIVGDLTTTRNSLDVFTTGSILYRLKVKSDNDTDDAWAFVFLGKNVADVSAGDIPNYRHKFPAGLSAGLVHTFSFGAVGVQAGKCCIIASSTGDVYAAAIGSDTFMAEGVYKGI